MGSTWHQEKVAVAEVESVNMFAQDDVGVYHRDIGTDRDNVKALRDRD